MARPRLLFCALVLAATFAVAQDTTSATSNSATQTAATPSQATAETNAPAHLRVYRARRFAGSALAPSIVVDGKQVARVGNGRRVAIKLSPGTHSVSSDDKSSAVSIDAKAGQDYYIRVDEETGFWKGHGKLTLLMAEQGSAEYKMQKPVESDRKFAKEMIEDEDGDTAMAEKPGKTK